MDGFLNSFKNKGCNMSNNLLFFDCESSGFLPKGRLVELAAVVTNDAGKDLLSMDMIVKPNGFVIPENVADIHGITTERAMDEGLPLSYVLDAFDYFVRISDIMVAHNISFDKSIMKNEFKIMDDLDLSNFNWGLPEFCTMKNATNYCKLPG